MTCDRMCDVDCKHINGINNKKNDLNSQQCFGNIIFFIDIAVGAMTMLRHKYKKKTKNRPRIRMLL